MYVLKLLQHVLEKPINSISIFYTSLIFIYFLYFLLFTSNETAMLQVSSCDFGHKLYFCFYLILRTYHCMLSHFSCVRLFATPWTAARQAPLSMGFSRQEYRSGLPFASPNISLEEYIFKIVT